LSADKRFPIFLMHPIASHAKIGLLVVVTTVVTLPVLAGLLMFEPYWPLSGEFVIPADEAPLLAELTFVSIRFRHREAHNTVRTLRANPVHHNRTKANDGRIDDTSRPTPIPKRPNLLLVTHLPDDSGTLRLLIGRSVAWLDVNGGQYVGVPSVVL
jgi:hypothetical protein